MRYLLTIVTIFSLTSVSAQPSGASERIKVVVFLALDCPISQKYIPTLNAWYDQYRSDARIEWMFVIPGKTARQEQRDFIKEYDVQFPLRRDPNLELVQLFGASTTPEVVIHKTSVLYRGAIDNWYYELGKYRQKTTETYAADALNAIAGGNQPTIRETKAIGCPIQTVKPGKP